MNMISSSNSMNPWCHRQLSDFLFYLCPECDFKDPNQQKFIEHASNFHPMSKEIFGITEKKVDCENNIETEEDYIDNELEEVLDEEKTLENNQKSVTELFETISSKVGSVRFKCYK